MKEMYISRDRQMVISSMVVNIVLILAEAFGLGEVFFRYLPGTEPFNWYDSLTYYTNLSNILLFIGAFASLRQDMRALQGKPALSLLYRFKFLGVVTTMVTFLTVYFFAIYLHNFVLAFSVHGNMWLLMHTICPLLGFLSLMFLEERGYTLFRICFVPVIFTFLYILMILAIHLTGGRVPYASDFTQEPIHVTAGFILGCGAIELVVCFLSGLGIWLQTKRILQREQKKTEIKA